MMPRLAIHQREKSFSERWMAFCEERQIPYVVVDCFDSDIIRHLASVDALLWHWHHRSPRERLMARQLITAAEGMGVTVFPSMRTCWHFDDKVAQKYLLESVDAPIVPTYVFYDLRQAFDWIDRTTFPKVFKLRAGAGSSNVHLVRSAREARGLARRAFTRGFAAVAPYGRDARKRLRARHRLCDLLAAMRRLPGTLRTIRQLNRSIGRERGYVYFQDFVPGNRFDTRVTVVGNRAFAYTRNVRPGDFRASGSGDIVYDIDRIRHECIEVAFEVTRLVGSQSMAFDFVLTPDQQPMIVEVSYCYVPELVYRCPGHWDVRLHWHEGHLWPQDAILLDLLASLERDRPSRRASLSSGSRPPSLLAAHGDLRA